MINPETITRYVQFEVAASIAHHGAESASSHLLAYSAIKLRKEIQAATRALTHEPSYCAALNALVEIHAYAHDLAHVAIELEALKLAPVLAGEHLPEARLLAEQEHESAAADLDRAAETLVQALTGHHR